MFNHPAEPQVTTARAAAAATRGPGARRGGLPADLEAAADGGDSSTSPDLVRSVHALEDKREHFFHRLRRSSKTRSKERERERKTTTTFVVVSFSLLFSSSSSLASSRARRLSLSLSIGRAPFCVGRLFPRVLCRCARIKRRRPLERVCVCVCVWLELRVERPIDHRL
jgi:hypothetical protein